jgi:cell division protein FtsL
MNELPIVTLGLILLTASLVAMFTRLARRSISRARRMTASEDELP